MLILCKSLTLKNFTLLEFIETKKAAGTWEELLDWARQERRLKFSETDRRGHWLLENIDGDEVETLRGVMVQLPNVGNHIQWKLAMIILESLGNFTYLVINGPVTWQGILVSLLDLGGAPREV